MSVEKIMDNVNVSRQSGSNRDQCIMEKIRSSPCTITVTRRGATHPSIRNTQEEEENPCNLEYDHPGKLPKLGKWK